MSPIRNAEPAGDVQLERLRRKRDQAWEMAGLARQDGDKADATRWTEEAQRLQREISAYQQ